MSYKTRKTYYKELEKIRKRKIKRNKIKHLRKGYF